MTDVVFVLRKKIQALPPGRQLGGTNPSLHPTNMGGGSTKGSHIFNQTLNWKEPSVNAIHQTCQMNWKESKVVFAIGAQKANNQHDGVSTQFESQCEVFSSHKVNNLPCTSTG